MKRTRHGKPIWGQEHLRAADAIALLSGVNYASVQKVLCAVMLLERQLGYSESTSEVTKFHSAPTVPVNPESLDDESIQRATAALSICVQIARNPGMQKAGGMLHLEGRFRGPKKLDL